jgi:hypothetical protein
MTDRRRTIMESTNDSSTHESTKSIADAVFDLGLTWAEYGLAHGKSALEHGARALVQTAGVLEALRVALKEQPKSADAGA